MEAAVLLFQGNGRGAFHTKDLVHWFARHDIVVREPAFTVEWTGIFMFTPIRAFRWISLDATRQLYCLSYTRGSGNVTLHIVYHTLSFLGLPGGSIIRAI